MSRLANYDPIYGRWFLLTVAPLEFSGVFTVPQNPPPFRECSLNDLYVHYRATLANDTRLTIPQDEMEGYYKENGWAIYRLGEGGNLLRTV